MSTPAPWPPGPETPELEPGKAHVWLVHLAGDADATALSGRERTRAERMATGAIRDRFVVAHAALRGILSCYCGVAPERLDIAAPERGKPHLHGQAAWQFNLSHSGDWGLVIVAREVEVGIDIEEIRPEVRVLELAQRFLAPEEAKHLAGLGVTARLDAFFRYWTCKEAFVKALGRGFDLPLRRFTVGLGADGAELAATPFEPAAAGRWRLHELSPVEGYRAAACLQAGGAVTGCWRWDVTPPV